MSVEQNKRVAEMFFEEVFNNKRVGFVDELVAGDVVDHNRVIFAQPEGPGGTAEGIRMLLQRFAVILDRVLSWGHRCFFRSLLRRRQVSRRVHHPQEQALTGPTSSQPAVVAFPDLSAVVERFVGEEDYVVAKVRLAGTNTGPYPRVPEPTGRHTEWESMVLFRLEDGKIAELWGTSDRMDMLTQLGMLPDIG